MRVVDYGLLAVFVALVANGACGESKTPTAPTPPPPAAPPAVTALTITGSVSFTRVGETSQMTATARFTDSTTKDVTNEARWESSNQAVTTVSANGVVTVAGFGTNVILATYAAQTNSIRVSATPPGTFVVFGRVREPGASGISGVRVREPQSGQVTFSGGGGEFSLPAVRSGRVTFEKDGYEAAQLDAEPNTFADAAMQWIVRVIAGETSEPQQLAPHDVSYQVGGEECRPCRRIRVIVSRAGTLRLTLTWTEPRSTLSMWAEGRRFVGEQSSITGEIPVSVGEQLVYVGMNPTPSTTRYVPFRLGTEVVR
jgi:Bacterial Ig-like domain (group 2)